jgi:hypothetical protein
MPQACTICTHPDRVEIDKLLADDAQSNRVVARQFKVGHDAIFRHRQNHLAASMVKAKEVEKAVDATTLLEQVQGLLQQAQRLTDAAEHSKNLGVALNGVRAIGSTLELLGKISGELKSSMSTTVNIAIALRDLSDDQVKQKLLDAGHAGWIRVNPSTPARNDHRVFELLAKGLSGCNEEQVGQILADADNRRALLANLKMNPSQSSSKPN